MLPRITNVVGQERLRYPMILHRNQLGPLLLVVSFRRGHLSIGTAEQRHNMVGQAAIASLALLVQDQIDKVKAGKKSGWEVDISDNGLLGVVFGFDWVGSGQDCSAGIKCADNTSLSH